MIWIALLLAAFVAIGLRGGASARRRHRLVLLASILMVAVTYFSFGTP